MSIKSTDEGYVNCNNQRVGKCTGLQSSRHPMSVLYHITCVECEHRYLAQSCDLYERKCPMCQKGAPSNSTANSIARIHEVENKTEDDALAAHTASQIVTDMIADYVQAIQTRTVTVKHIQDVYDCISGLEQLMQHSVAAHIKALMQVKH